MIRVVLTDGIEVTVYHNDMDGFGKEIRRLWKQDQWLEVSSSEQDRVRYVNPKHIIYWEQLK